MNLSFMTYSLGSLNEIQASCFSSRDKTLNVHKYSELQLQTNNSYNLENIQQEEHSLLGDT